MWHTVDGASKQSVRAQKRQVRGVWRSSGESQGSVAEAAEASAGVRPREGESSSQGRAASSPSGATTEGGHQAAAGKAAPEQRSSCSDSTPSSPRPRLTPIAIVTKPSTPRPPPVVNLRWERTFPWFPCRCAF